MKKKLAIITSIFLLIFGIVTNGFSQWVQTSGPEGGSVKCIAINGSTIFAGAGTGISVSTNNGMTWKFSGLENKYVSAIMVKDQFVFAGTDSGIFRSGNNGISWEPMNKGLTDSTIAAFAIIGNRIFTATLDGPIFISTNDGMTWTDIKFSQNSYGATKLAVIGATLFAGTDGVYISTDFGTSWTSPDFSLGILTSLTAIGTDLYAGTRYNYLKGGPLMHSADEGKTWEQLIDLDPYYATSIALVGRSLILGTGGEHLLSRTDGEGILISFDKGVNWIAADSTINSATIYSLAENGTNIFAATDQGMLISNQSAINWTRINNGLKCSSVPNIVAIGSNLFAGSAGNGVFVSHDQGANWITVNKDIGSGTIQDLKASGKNLYAAKSYGVFHSTDNGSTWSFSNKGLSWYVNSIALVDTLVFVGTGDLPQGGAFFGGLFSSTDNGLTWKTSNLNSFGDYISGFIANGENLFARTLPNGFFLSTDKGNSWIDIRANLPGTDAIPIQGSGADIIISTDSGLFLSANNGSSWININHGLPTSFVSSVIQIGKIFFAGTLGKGVFLSTNKGADWKAINEGLVPNEIESVFISEGFLYVGTNGAGVWKRTLSDFGISSVYDQSQSDINLSLSPNPTNGIITVHNASANILHVTVSSILGESVLELEHPNAPDFTLDLSKLPQGIYFARFSLANGVVTRKIIRE